jgi:predicted SAM-dependent methyltransferase
MNNSILEIRKKSVVTQDSNLEHLITIKKFPAYIGSTTLPKEDDILVDMVWDICKDSGVIQLRNLLKPEIVYPKYHSEAIGGVWDNHHKEFSNIICKLINNKEKSNYNIFEIGGSNGKLSSLVLKNTNKIKKWTIVDPNCSKDIQIEKEVNIINSFFDSNFIDKNKKIDLIIHSHTLEHMYDIDKFIKDIANALPIDGYNVFSIPNLYLQLKNKYVNTINFEHTVFLTETIVDFLLSNNKLKVVDKKYYGEHSIFYITKKVNNIQSCELKNNYEEYKEMYISCVDYYKKFVNDVNEKILNFNGDIYLFGGHVFSQFLLNLGLNSSRIKSILDNSKLKDKTRLYGYDLEINLPDSIEIKDNSAIILKVGSYRDEIITKLKAKNSNIIIWE